MLESVVSSNPTGTNHRFRDVSADVAACSLSPAPIFARAQQARDQCQSLRGTCCRWSGSQPRAGCKWGLARPVNLFSGRTCPCATSACARPACVENARLSTAEKAGLCPAPRAMPHRPGVPMVRTRLRAAVWHRGPNTSAAPTAVYIAWRLATPLAGARLLDLQKPGAATRCTPACTGLRRWVFLAPMPSALW